MVEISELFCNCLKRLLRLTLTQTNGASRETKYGFNCTDCNIMKTLNIDWIINEIRIGIAGLTLATRTLLTYTLSCISKKTNLCCLDGNVA